MRGRIRATSFARVENPCHECADCGTGLQPVQATDREDTGGGAAPYNANGTSSDSSTAANTPEEAENGKADAYASVRVRFAFTAARSSALIRPSRLWSARSSRGTGRLR